MEGANIVPVMDMNRNNNYGDCWGGGMWFMWIIVLFALAHSSSSPKDRLGHGTVTTREPTSDNP